MKLNKKLFIENFLFVNTVPITGVQSLLRYFKILPPSYTLMSCGSLSISAPVLLNSTSSIST